MSDEKKPAPVINLADARLKRVENAGPEAHAKGEAMALMRYVFDERGIGYDPDPDQNDISTEVIVIVNGYQKGIAMSALDAMRLGEALVRAWRNAPSTKPRPLNAYAAQPRPTMADTLAVVGMSNIHEHLLMRHRDEARWGRDIAPAPEGACPCVVCSPSGGAA